MIQVSKEILEQNPALNTLLKKYNAKSGEGRTWDSLVSPFLTIVEVSPNKVVFEFTVKERHCNQVNIIHGGCVATLIDICSSFAILMAPKPWKWIGITTDLAVSYMKGIGADQVARIECEAQRVGKNLASLSARIYDQNNALCYSGSHSKFCTDSRL